MREDGCLGDEIMMVEGDYDDSECHSTRRLSLFKEL